MRLCFRPFVSTKCMGFHWNGTRRYQVRRVDLRCLRERFEDLLFRWVRRWVRRWERRRPPTGGKYFGGFGGGGFGTPCIGSPRCKGSGGGGGGIFAALFDPVGTGIVFYCTYIFLATGTPHILTSSHPHTSKERLELD